jgi:uncharacterized protein with FMN-binding domain
MREKVEGRRGAWKVVWTILWVLGAVFVILVVVALAALAITEKERREGRELPIGVVDFGAISDGTHQGAYAGGRYKWRANEVRVTVSSGRVTDVDVVTSAKTQPPKTAGPLFERVIEAQSLQVDTISGATITSKAFLKSVEKALLDASGAGSGGGDGTP